MQYINIHDYENARVIWAQVPEYITEKAEAIDKANSAELIAQAIFDALGLSAGNCEYMIGEDIEHVLADHNADTSRNARGIELLAQNFREDALASLKEAEA